MFDRVGEVSTMSFDLKSALSAIFLKGKYEVAPGYSQFAINQYLSKYKQYIKIVSQLQTLKLPDAAHFKFLQKNTNYGWPPKVNLDKVEEDPTIEYVMRYYKCSRRDAKDYLLFMDKEDLDEIKFYYEYKGDKVG